MSEIDCYQFDGYRFYVSGGYLEHEGEQVPIQPLAGRVLALLLKSRGTVVTHETFAMEAWGQKGLSDGILSNQILSLRKIFGDAGDTYIKTAPRRGYRFEGPVRPCSGGHDGTLVNYFDRFGFFEDYTERFSELFPRTKSLTLHFIHSRRWRENHRHELNAFLERPDSRMTVFLPNLDNELLMDGLRSGFLDGPAIPHLTLEAYRDFADYSVRFPGQVSIWRFAHYPTYSFYLFDAVLIAAMYPTVVARHQVPTLELSPESPYWRFFEDDRKVLRLESEELSKTKVGKLISIK
jgi:DNA-binding winged helix-turn-helix (wHTH) protein